MAASYQKRGLRVFVVCTICFAALVGAFAEASGTESAASEALIPSYAYNPSPGLPEITVPYTENVKPLKLWGIVGFLPALPLGLWPNSVLQPILSDGVGYYLGLIIYPITLGLKKPPSSSELCRKNMQALSEAVKLYNAEHPDKLCMIDEQVCEALWPMYHDDEFYKSDDRCSYFSVGDLSQPGSGMIYCTKHGTCGNTHFVVLPTARYRDLTPWPRKLWNKWAHPVIDLLVNIPIFILGLWLTWKLLMLPIVIYKKFSKKHHASIQSKVLEHFSDPHLPVSPHHSNR